MKLFEFADIQSEYHSRGAIEAREDGSHFLLQARDVETHRLTCSTEGLARFTPALSRKDWPLQDGDILFMARRARNYTVPLRELPDPDLAAACFFIVPVTTEKVVPAYLSWYLNQAPAEHYFRQHSGRGVHMPVVTRQTLENIDVPLPSGEVQGKVTDLDALLRQEENLLAQLMEKRRQLITNTCFQAIRRG